MLEKLFSKTKSPISFLVCEKEYHSPELSKLLEWFKNDGWTSQEQSWGVVGSQEITAYDVTKGDITIQLIFETYEGVTLYTPKEHEHLFDAIKLIT